MNSKILLFAVFGVLIVAGVFFALRPTSQKAENITETSSKREAVASPRVSPVRIVTITIADRVLTSEEKTISLKEGEEVLLKITSDEEEEFHLHGYDKSIALSPGTEVELAFTATLTGRFPFELEHSGTELGAIEVRPKK